MALGGPITMYSSWARQRWGLERFPPTLSTGLRVWGQRPLCGECRGSCPISCFLSPTALTVAIGLVEALLLFQDLTCGALLRKEERRARYMLVLPPFAHIGILEVEAQSRLGLGPLHPSGDSKSSYWKCFVLARRRWWPALGTWF